MALEIREWLGTCHKTRSRNAVYRRGRVVNGQIVQSGFMPSLSPPGHPHCPYWLPGPDAGEWYAVEDSGEEQYQKAREFLFRR